MKRSDRLVGMTNYLLEHPLDLVSLPFFSERYDAAKSSISEDLTIIDNMFKFEGIGYLESIPGAAGGIRYIPKYDQQKSMAFVDSLAERLNDPSRILPGGYLFMSDLLGEPTTVREIGRLFATAFASLNIEVVVTVATKGIPLAYAVASFLNVPVVIARRDPKITEGSTVSINYVSGSSRKIQSMVLTRRSLKQGSTVCIIDDFMKAGGTIDGMKSLLKEFDATVAAIGVLAEAEDEEDERVVTDYTSLLKIAHVDDRNKEIEVVRGNYFN
ncbi:MAG: pur operon repressor [Amphibacillus sp.]|uniref:Pur operon repressor n=1 Tax=Amphibacillus xylanus (strain ATCC 51415 / DSM 6626 / JCM 7361 / LMG 17667 / NBRC 15112 / Ep01) TaxID=698758 RepID=K0J5K4_AMPXN|nr:pur operon repressor [Amphibacillus xylanus]NMA89951.1 pur operon repressor [Amphibacillus sp.]BAM46183.1 pur operon repressor [Amphibacillus xylanus NBRC 15112]